MTCFDFENRVQSLLDQRQLVLPDELAAHASRCPACDERWKSFQRLHAAVDVWNAPSITPPLADAVLERLQTERVVPASTATRQVLKSHSTTAPLRPHRHSAMTVAVAMLASVVAMLIAVGIGWRVSSEVLFAKRQSAAQPTLAANSKALAAGAGTSENPNDRQLEVLLHDARDAYVALASQAWQQMSTTNVLLPSAEITAPFMLEEPPHDFAEPFAKPLAPFGRELRDTVDSWIQHVFNSQDSST